MKLKPISFSGGVKSISDDDLCATCRNCKYRPGEMSGCKQGWPGMEDENGYVRECEQFERAAGGSLDWGSKPQCCPYCGERRHPRNRRVGGNFHGRRREHGEADRIPVRRRL